LDEYEKTLMNRLDNIGGSKDKELMGTVDRYNEWADMGYYDLIVHNFSAERPPPFPLLDMYQHMVWHLGAILEEKTRFFVFSFVIQLGEGVNSVGSSRRRISMG
jgi:hypothetical protein